MGIRAVDERRVQFKIGVMVLATLLMLAILVTYFKGRYVSRILGIDRILGIGTYTIYIDFPEAPGVAENTPIRQKGIRIGQVTKVESDERGVHITAEIE